MLKVPKLSDITYDQMVQRAIHRIPSMTEQWTDFNYHDPGITVLQTYAWLVDMLNYYMDATGDIHILKYLKLLGLTPKEAKAATAYLNMESQKQNTVLFKGTPVYAGNVPFEIDRDYAVKTNHFVSFINEVDGVGMDLTMFAGVDGDYASLFAAEFKKQAIGYFGFQEELKGELEFQICVKENQYRNPFETEFSMSSLKWQYYGEHGWKDLEEIQDETCGFLRSGILKAVIPEKTVPYQCEGFFQRAHYIRCILKENTYDMLPEVGRIYVNPICAQQKKTLSREVTLTYDGKDRVTIPCYIPLQSYLMVAIENGEEGGHLIYDEGAEWKSDIVVEQGKNCNEKVLYFSNPAARPAAGSVLKIFVVREEFFADFRPGNTNGCANQEVPFLYDNVYEISITTWKEAKDGRHEYQQWHYVPILEQVGYQEKVFTYDFNQKVIRFGDGEHGVVPKQGQRICITGCSISAFENGNVLEQEIKELGVQYQTDIKVSNPLNAVGGRSQQQPEDLIEILQQELFAQNRLVSAKDYKDTVSKTPGLMIEEVEVLSGKRYGEIHDVNWKDNEVVVVVKPHSPLERPQLNEFYKEKIAETLEDLRLINTKVSIASPSYVGIEINGKIKLSNKRPGEEAEIKELLKEIVLSPQGESHFGKKLVVGKIFSKLETLESVNRIYSLSLERLGAGAVKNQRGDVILYEDALCYLSSINLEFC